MPRPLRTAAFAALLLVAAAVAFAPVLLARYSADDLPYLVRASPAAEAGAVRAASRLAEPDGPLARLSLDLSSRLWAREGRWNVPAARALRFENLALLLATAALARLALRRALLPWAGLDGARAAAGACALLVACHPLCVPAVAASGARGDLLAACLSAASAALFLRGRQERRVPETALAAVAALLAGQASGLALLLPPLLAVLELASARRQRPLHVRVRTAATTLVVFGACVAAEAATGPLLGAPAILPGTLRSAWSGLGGEGLGPALGSLASGLGAIAFPVPQGTTGAGPAQAAPVAFVDVLLGVLLLASLEPALVAARSAPRLWASLASATGAGVLLALGVSAPASRSATCAWAAFPAALVACAGFAVASTALSGVRRVLVPAALAASFALLSHAVATSVREEGLRLGLLQASLGAARAAHGGTAEYFVVGPDESEAGARRPWLPLLLDPSVCPASARGDSARVRSLSLEGLLAFSREPDFAALRRGEVVILLPPAGMEGLRGVVAVAPPSPSTGTLSWRENLTSPLFDVDPLERRALRAVALPTASTAEAPRMGWRAGESETHGASGVWIQEKGGPTAVFDFSGSVEWLLGPRVRRAWLEPGVGRVALAELLADVPAIPGRVEPAVSGSTWSFELDRESLPRPAHGEARLALVLLDLETLRRTEFAPRKGASGAGAVFDVAPAAVEGSPIAWSLELRCGELCVARTSGRR